MKPIKRRFFSSPPSSRMIQMPKPCPACQETRTHHFVIYLYPYRTDGRKRPRYYTGLTKDISRRWNEHLKGKRGHEGKNICNVPRILHECHETFMGARARELQVKSLSKKEKAALYSGGLCHVSPSMQKRGRAPERE